MSVKTRRFAAAALLAATLAVSIAGSASASPPVPVEPIDPPISIPAEDSCVDFGLLIGSTAGKIRTVVFHDAAGKPVRIIEVGTGISYTYTNDTTHESITTKASGSAKSTVYNPDGTQTITATGHNGLIMFATDVPGPSATAYRGRIVYNVDPVTGIFTLLSATGASLDICAALA